MKALSGYALRLPGAASSRPNPLPAPSAVCIMFTSPYMHLVILFAFIVTLRHFLYTKEPSPSLLPV